MSSDLNIIAGLAGEESESSANVKSIDANSTVEAAVVISANESNEKRAKESESGGRDFVNRVVEIFGSTPATEGNKINDFQFIHDLTLLKELRSFLLQEAAISLSKQGTDELSFGALNLLRYGEGGRAPTLQEWSDVERHTQSLFRVLTEPLRRRFLLGQIPSWINFLPMFLAVVALGALAGAVVVQGRPLFGLETLGAKILPFYLVWLTSLGAIGSVAFIGMNALSVQQDITFDLTNRRLMVLRIVLGALFGLVLTLPFGFEKFQQFVAGIYWGSKTSEALGPTGTITAQAMSLLLPFILGFSTSLVIMVLNRLVDGVQAFFGRAGDRTLGNATQASGSEGATKTSS